jgi:SNF2 family DNA or RNA helicase
MAARVSRVAVLVEVRSGVAPDKLILVPRHRGDKHRLHAALRGTYPLARWHLGAEGVSVAAFDAVNLLSNPPSEFRWTAEAERVVSNRQRVISRHDAIKILLNQMIAGGAGMARERLRNAPALSVLDDHQWVNVACMTIEDGYGLCVFDEQGAGKTVTTIFAFDTLVDRNLADFMLIVAPKSMIAEWPNDFARFLPDQYEVKIATGSLKNKRVAMASRPDVLVTNFETVVSMEEELRSLLAGYGNKSVLVVDESFYAKNLDAKRTIALRRLREWCGWAYVLCGTPAPNSPHDLIQQFNIVDFGITFLEADVPEDRVAAKSVVQNIINERGLYVRHQKVQVLPDLPAKTFNRVYVPLQPQQARLYESALNNLIADLRSTDEAAFQREIVSFLARRSALLQICSSPGTVADGYTEVPAKLLALDDLLNDLIEQRREKVIVWSFYTASILAIVNRFAKYNPVRYDGTVADVAERRAAVQKFQSDEQSKLFVGNPAAAGAGLTLHRSRFAIYESMSNQAAHYLQSLDRIHRRGQTRGVEYVILLCKNTIEDEEYARLIAKEKSASELLGDQPISSITYSSMLSELTAARQRILRRGDS